MRLAMLAFAAISLTKSGLAISRPQAISPSITGKITEKVPGGSAENCIDPPEAKTPCDPHAPWEPYIPIKPIIAPSSAVQAAIGKLSGFVGNWSGTAEDKTPDGDRFVWNPYRSFEASRDSIAIRNFEDGRRGDPMWIVYDEKKGRYKISVPRYWFGYLIEQGPIYGDLADDGSLSWTAQHVRGPRVDTVRTTIRIVDGHWRETEQLVEAGKPDRIIQEMILSKTDELPKF